MERTLRALAPLGVGAALALLPLSGNADTVPAASPQSFLVTTMEANATGTVTHRDVVLVRGDVAMSNGIAAAERDRSCLAVLHQVVAASGDRKPYAIGVAFGSEGVVTVPMTATVAVPAAGARLIQAGGDVAADVPQATVKTAVGIHLDARVLDQDGALAAATFRQTTYLSAQQTAQPLSVSGCDVQRLPATTVTDGAPGNDAPGNANANPPPASTPI